VTVLNAERIRATVRNKARVGKRISSQLL
jgi:hypothetical protein